MYKTKKTISTLTVFFISFFVLICDASANSYRLDSLYCYDYNVENQAYQIKSRHYYQYNELDLLVERQEEIFLNDEFGTWQIVSRNTYQYHQNGQVAESIMQVFDEASNALENSTKINFNYEEERLLQQVRQAWNETAQTWELDNRIIYIYQNDILSIERIEDYQVSTDTWEYVSQEIFAYDAEQWLVSKRTQLWQDDMWQEHSRWLYSDFIGTEHRRAMQQFWEATTATWDNNQQILSSYENELLIKKVYQEWIDSTQAWSNILEKNYEYDAKGELIATFDRNWTIINYDYKPASRTLTTYQDDGQILEEQMQIWFTETNSWLPTDRTRQVYDEENFLIESYDENWSEDSNEWETFNRYIYLYDSLNYLVQSFKQQPSGGQFFDFLRIDYVRDDTGRLLEENTYFLQADWVLFQQESYQYDSLERLKTRTSSYFDFASNMLLPNTQTLFVYNDNDQVIEQIEHNWQSASETWQVVARELSTYQAQGHIKRQLRQHWNNFEEVWTNGLQTVYHYNENAFLAAITKESWQMNDWFLLEKTSYQNDSNGQAISADYQVFQNETFEFFKWLYEFNENQQATLVELQNRDTPIYDWVYSERCDYFRSSPTILKEVSSSNLACLFPNPYPIGMPISCHQLGSRTTYQLRLYNLQGQLLYQKPINGTEFSITGNWSSGLYLMGIFYLDEIVQFEKVFIDK